MNNRNTTRNHWSIETIWPSRRRNAENDIKILNDMNLYGQMKSVDRQSWEKI